ncbi:Short chain dehydrogenase-like protein 31 [Elsinoe fawcettii]|nr:Short chain dehydrogenase-like protein 31 [Elsinoe fawcettii]
MVAYKEILASNSLLDNASTPRTAVFVGGTAGIGRATVEALVKTGASVKIYLLGRRSSRERTKDFIANLRMINSNARVIWIEAEVSLLAEVSDACKMIMDKEDAIDLLFLTTGYAPFTARQETTEGHEITMTLSYYSRILFIMRLLPLLNRAAAPRVVSVLGGGLESSSIYLDDIDLREPDHFGPAKAQKQYLTMNTVTMEKLASENPNITFTHSWPGWINTGNVRRGLQPNSTLAWIIWFLLEPLIWLLAFNEEKGGQLHLYIATSQAFGGHGVPCKSGSGLNTAHERSPGLFLVDRKCNSSTNDKVMSSLRRDVQPRVWAHTESVLEAYL